MEQALKAVLMQAVNASLSVVLVEGNTSMIQICLNVNQRHVLGDKVD